MRLMLVEDDASLRMVLAAYFRNEGVEVLASPADGQEALDLLESLHPDVILTACQMPRIDGISMVRLLRERGDYTPVIMMSGQKDPTIRAMARDAGVSFYLDKPLSLVALNRVLDQTIHGSAA